ncbi:solute carrier family 23 member 2 [Plakobranchus ocellatus]|uniref:Solute carrier family 23 member 2 n=1 Tax=Plakobranchus ocellatus TaxID=259542 RepID=A0AAV3XZI1_9GAST|nr:solute carrier family 23 member 2 [Plakobranchus ocellatus]
MVLSRTYRVQVLISVLVGWALSGILTASGYFTDDKTSNEYLARTDAKGDIIAQADFFEMPYPGKFGGYSYSIAGFTTFLIASLLSIFDSVGDYSACARAARVAHPPKFAFNRGIAVEGLATVMAGSLGCCHSTVSYGGNIGAISITGVASRRVFQLCGGLYVLAATIGKVGALFITIPMPVLGGSSIVLTGLFIGVLLSYLENISLRSTRNLAIIGISLLLGMMMPYWIKNNTDRVKTGFEQLDMLIVVLLSNPSFVGGIFACFMDNTAPGTLRERGLEQQLKELEGQADDTLPHQKDEFRDGREIYRLPFIPKAFRRSRIAKLIPLFDHSEH